MDLRTAELRRSGEPPWKLSDQPFQILAMLLEHSGDLVTRDEIRNSLWPNGTIVEFEHSINAAINRLRLALGDSAEDPHFIETLARRGYRWMVPVEWCETGPEKASVAPTAVAETQRTRESLIGKKVTHYRVLEVLGGGGMGVVYRAEDLRLGRHVAIKFLGEEFSGDNRALERFEREARAISALDHPNICTLYEVEEQEGQPFIVMQLLQGQTLRQRMESAEPEHLAFLRSELLDFSIQIVTGLEAAHQKDIIHRDVKPANIFITTRGEVKLLDFGLAKLVDAEGIPSASAAAQPRETGPQDSAFGDGFKSSMTLTGAMMGTASYMSPEQVRKGQLDARSDLFSFGVVLYEMATGRQPFRGDGIDLIQDAILNYAPPSPLAWNPDLPTELETIIGRALEKDRERRYQSASEIAADLQRLKRDSESGRAAQAVAPAVQDAASPRTTIANTTKGVQHAGGLGGWKFLLLAAFATLLMAAYAAHRHWPQSKAPSRPVKLSRISHWNKPMIGARLSPNGRMVAYSSPVGTVEQIFVIPTSGGEPLQLTHDEDDKSVDSFSPDSTEIYYGRTLGRDEEWAVPTLGGTPRRVASGCCLAPSPDGRSLFYLKSDSRAVFRTRRSAESEEKMYSFDNPPLLPLSLLPFPNGNDLLVTAVAQLSDEKIRLYKVNLPNGTAVDLGTLSDVADAVMLGEKLGDLVWAEPGKTLFLSRNVDGLINLWKYSLINGGFTQVTSDPGPDLSPMPDPRTGGIYFVNGNSSGLLTVYHAPSKEFAEIEQEEASQPIISPDRKHVVYVKFGSGKHDAGSGRDELWASNLDGTNKIRLASSGQLFTGEWAPNSSRVSFFDNSGGGGSAYVVEADGQGLRSIGRFEEPIDWITWSADGSSLYVTTWKNKSERSLWKTSADGSSTEKFLDNACTVMDASADGQYLLCSLLWGDGAGIYEISVRDKKIVPLLPGVESQPTRFASDGKSFLYAEFSRAGVTLYRQAWRDGKLIGKPETALRLPFGFNVLHGGNALDFSRDLSEIAYGRGSGQANLYLLSGAQ